MSQLRIVDRGENNFLTLIFAEAYTLHLFTTDVETGLTETQLNDLALADFTEATFTGYAEVALSGWSIVSGDPSRSTHAQVTFTRSSTGTAETIFGYYVTMDFDSDEVAFYEQFDSPVVMELINDAIKVTPRVTLRDEIDAAEA